MDTIYTVKSVTHDGDVVTVNLDITMSAGEYNDTIAEGRTGRLPEIKAELEAL